MPEPVRVSPGYLQAAAERVGRIVLQADQQTPVQRLCIVASGFCLRRIGPGDPAADACGQVKRHERLARAGSPFDEGHAPQRNPVSPQPADVMGFMNHIDQWHVEPYFAARFGVKNRQFLIG